MNVPCLLLEQCNVNTELCRLVPVLPFSCNVSTRVMNVRVKTVEPPFYGHIIQQPSHCAAMSFKLKTFKATFYSSSQMIIFVNDEYKVALKVFKRVKHLWVLKFHKNNAFSAIILNGIIFEKFQAIGV